MIADCVKCMQAVEKLKAKGVSTEDDIIAVGSWFDCFTKIQLSWTRAVAKACKSPEALSAWRVEYDLTSQHAMKST